MNKAKIFIPLLLIIVLFGCKSRKKYAGPNVNGKTKDSVSVNEVMTADRLLDNTLTDWTYFSSKAAIEYVNGNNTQSVGSNIRMYKDSLVWVSVNIFGIEGARIIINKDSMIVWDKLHKNYKVYDKELVESILGAPLSVGEIQHILIAKPVYALSLYQIIANTEAYLKIKLEQPKFFVNHSYQKQYYTIDTTLIEDKTAPHYARVNYFNFVNINNHNFPLKNQINAYNGQSMIQINMDFEDPDFVTEVNFPFNIPSTHERIK